MRPSDEQRGFLVLAHDDGYETNAVNLGPQIIASIVEVVHYTPQYCEMSVNMTGCGFNRVKKFHCGTAAP